MSKAKVTDLVKIKKNETVIIYVRLRTLLSVSKQEAG
jgi:hypothetical protein